MNRLSVNSVDQGQHFFNQCTRSSRVPRLVNIMEKSGHKLFEADGQPDGRTDGRTDDGEFNSPPSSLREAGDNKCIDNARYT